MIYNFNYDVCDYYLNFEDYYNYIIYVDDEENNFGLDYDNSYYYYE